MAESRKQGYEYYNINLLGRRLTAILPNRGKHVTHDGQARYPTWASSVPIFCSFDYPYIYKGNEDQYHDKRKASGIIVAQLGGKRRELFYAAVAIALPYLLTRLEKRRNHKFLPV